MFYDRDLIESRLIVVLDVLMDANEPLTIQQIQRRASEKWNMDASREEIGRLLRWGSSQPGMNKSPVKPKMERHSDPTKWGVVPKDSSTVKFKRFKDRAMNEIYNRLVGSTPTETFERKIFGGIASSFKAGYDRQPLPKFIRRNTAAYAAFVAGKDSVTGRMAKKQINEA